MLFIPTLYQSFLRIILLHIYFQSCCIHKDFTTITLYFQRCCHLSNSIITPAYTQLTFQAILQRQSRINGIVNFCREDRRHTCTCNLNDRRTANVIDKVQHMSSIIHNAATTGFLVTSPCTTLSLQNHRAISLAHKMERLAYNTSIHQTLGLHKCTDKTVVITHLVYLAILLGCFHHDLTVFLCKRKRLFTEYVTSMFQSINHHFLVQLSRSNYIYSIRLGFINHFLVVCITSNLC